MAVNTKRIIGAFCEAVGVKSLTATEWKKYGHQVRLLIQKGYTEEDILNAIEYAKNHVKNFYGFGMIFFVIDKARGSKPSKLNSISQPKSLLDEFKGGVANVAAPSTTKPDWMKTEMEVL